MAKHFDPARLTQPYFQRKIFYGILGLIGAGLFAFGVADAAQIEEWTTVAIELGAPALLMLFSAIVTPKTTAASDQAPPAPTRKSPVNLPSPQEVAGRSLLQDLQERIAQGRG